MIEVELFKLTVIFLTGASLGSFVNVMVMRMEKGESFVRGRSKCPKCNHPLSLFDTIPFISYAMLIGKCRYCGKPISFRYPVSELLGGLAGVLSYFKCDLSIRGIIELVVMLNLLAIALYDYDTMYIPDIYIISLGIFTIGDMIIGSYTPFERGAGALVIGIPMLFLIVTTGGFGIGDLFLAVIMGLCFGYKKVVIGFILAIIIGSLEAIYLIVRKNRTGKDYMPFAPVFCLGMAIAVFFGERIIDIYSSLLP